MLYLCKHSVLGIWEYLSAIELRSPDGDYFDPEKNPTKVT